MMNGRNVSGAYGRSTGVLIQTADADFRARSVRACLAVTAVMVVWLLLPTICSATLPDGRVYEEVSPANKNGNVVEPGWFGLAAESGNAVAFVGTGAMGTAYFSGIGDFVARRSPVGWTTSSATPRPLGAFSLLTESPLTLVLSSDFSRALFGAGASYVSSEPLADSQSVNLFLSENPAVEPIWLGQPTAEPPGFFPTPAVGQSTEVHDYLIAGGSPSLGTVYFTYSGTLIPQDASRTPNVGDGQAHRNTDAWGFYEWSQGVLKEGGILPNGTLSPFGAVPAAIAGGTNFSRRFSADPFVQAQALDNEVSTDGTRVFFMSPDPAASTATDSVECAKEGPCTDATPELYVRKTAPDGSKSTTLVSQSQLPGHEGEAAPNGLVKVPNAPRNRLDEGEPEGETYVYASPDGSQAFFASADQLTSAAPNDGTVKEYDFNVDTGELTYLPGVVGPIVVSSRGGSNFIFENTATNPDALDLWTSGAGGGQVTPITPLPAGPADIDGARATANGSVFVFRTDSSLPGGFNNGGGFMQVYRYESGTAPNLDCVSCPPIGITPSGDAQVSYDNAGTGNPPPRNGQNNNPMSTLDTRVISTDGSRVFFDTPDPLVTQDSNGTRDVYEWEKGKVFLISSGKGTEESYVLDSSASGDDVFFTTTLGLVPGDRDTGYDVYDARVPRTGDNPPSPAAPCQGDACQGSPSVSSLLGVPSSATFNGAGNITPSEVPVTGSGKKKPIKKLQPHHKKPKKKVKRHKATARRGHSTGQRRGR